METPNTLRSSQESKPMIDPSLIEDAKANASAAMDTQETQLGERESAGRQLDLFEGNLEARRREVEERDARVRAISVERAEAFAAERKEIDNDAKSFVDRLKARLHQLIDSPSDIGKLAKDQLMDIQVTTSQAAENAYDSAKEKMDLAVSQRLDQFSSRLDSFGEQINKALQTVMDLSAKVNKIIDSQESARRNERAQAYNETKQRFTPQSEGLKSDLVDVPNLSQGEELPNVDEVSDALDPVKEILKDSTATDSSIDDALVDTLVDDYKNTSTTAEKTVEPANPVYGSNTSEWQMDAMNTPGQISPEDLTGQSQESAVEETALERYNPSEGGAEAIDESVIETVKSAQEFVEVIASGENLRNHPKRAKLDQFISDIRHGLVNPQLAFFAVNEAMVNLGAKTNDMNSNYFTTLLNTILVQLQENPDQLDQAATEQQIQDVKAMIENQKSTSPDKDRRRENAWGRIRERNAYGGLRERYALASNIGGLSTSAVRR